MNEHERIAKVLAAVKDGIITTAEADAYLRATTGRTYTEVTGGKQARNARAPLTPTAAVALLLVVAVLLTGILLLHTTSPAGLVVLDVPRQSTPNTTLSINETITSLNVSGALYGDGNASVYFDTANGSFLVASITSDSGAPRTDKPSYALGDEVGIEHAPASASYYFDDGAASTAVDIPFNATGNGTLLIVANMSGDLTTYRLPIIIGTAQRVVAFDSICLQTCSMAPSNGSLRIITAGNTTLDVSRVDAAVVAANAPPHLAIAFAPLSINTTVAVNLSQHFVDPDGDALYYTVGTNDNVDARIDGSMLILTPVKDGSSDLAIYASDLQELIPAAITVTVTAVSNMTSTANATVDVNASNMMQDAALENSSENATTIQTTDVALNNTQQGNASIPPLDCTNANPNLRPAECLLQNATAFFPEQEIYWENLDRLHVAKFTVIGNLMITGSVIEHSTGDPGPRDFRISYPDQDGNMVSTIWVDSTTGDLHLRGSIIEENINLQPPAGSYSIITKRSIYVAYADIGAGDLYIRGNVIANRGTI